ncbi:MAG TPA: hypothetical protein VFU36_03690 [Jatrophihabitans sp.]|nr:hypothetical protein [Jatrophihabitans sp.]
MTMTTPVRPAPPAPRRETLRGRLARRRAMARRDRLTARLLELREIAELVQRAGTVIEGGWVQYGWYRYRSAEDAPSGGHDSGDHDTVTGACLVGAVVHAGGGRRAFTSQLVQRALDLTWSTLYGLDGDSLAWCPPPAVRFSHLRDLTRWNDAPARTKGEVLDLLAATRTEAGRLSELIRAERLETVPS